jgi:hypothetical protein
MFGPLRGGKTSSNLDNLRPVAHNKNQNLCGSPRTEQITSGVPSKGHFKVRPKHESKPMSQQDKSVHTPPPVCQTAGDLSFALVQVYRETDRFLDDLLKCVREVKRVDEASRFARWLRFSGICTILEQNLNSSSSSLYSVDAKALRKKADELLYQCGELFRQNKANPTYAASDIAEINRKLDSLLAAKQGESLGVSPALFPQKRFLAE